jgi:hypothetical protein
VVEPICVVEQRAQFGRVIHIEYLVGGIQPLLADVVEMTDGSRCKSATPLTPHLGRHRIIVDHAESLVFALRRTSLHDELFGLFDNRFVVGRVCISVEANEKVTGVPLNDGTQHMVIIIRE